MIDFLSTTRGKVTAGLVLLAGISLILIYFFALSWFVPTLVAVIALAVLLLVVEIGVRAWRRRKQAALDETLAAKEGIEDRKKEWARWSEELRKHGIDRYDLPFFLMVGEPQGGKSVLLKNSGLHFPFGQEKLSGIGGTRGCDWWFTEEAVILDLAGRLFTHEGGASDQAEWEAFLAFLADYRPHAPINGVLLVLPCDSLATDDAETALHKANVIQSSLTTLVNKLQARFPVYVILTKGDQVFGFAEAVHRLDLKRRQQMFGWSRPSDKVNEAFDLRETREGLDGLVDRALLLRDQMVADARVPEALPEVDRLYAFPDELTALRPSLEQYLDRIFHDSGPIDRLLFRGVYLTSGLQTGAPIAKALAGMAGVSGEADTRDLEALFTKQRAYFIHDLIAKRVVRESGLVQPTRRRVQATRRKRLVGYGAAAAVALVAIGTSLAYVSTKKASVSKAPGRAVEAAENLAGNPDRGESDVLTTLLAIRKAIDPEGLQAYEKAFDSAIPEFRELYSAVFDSELLPTVRKEAEQALGQKPEDYKHFLELAEDAVFLLGGVDLTDPTACARVRRILPRERDMVLGRFIDDRRLVGAGRPEWGASDWRGSTALEPTVSHLRMSWDLVLSSGSAVQTTEGTLGFLLSWKGLETYYPELTSFDPLTDREADCEEEVVAYHRSDEYFKKCRAMQGEGTELFLRLADLERDLKVLEAKRNEFLVGIGDQEDSGWVAKDQVLTWARNRAKNGGIPFQDGLVQKLRNESLAQVGDDGLLRSTSAAQILDDLETCRDLATNELAFTAVIGRARAAGRRYPKDWQSLSEELGGPRDRVSTQLLAHAASMRALLVSLHDGSKHPLAAWIESLDELTEAHIKFAINRKQHLPVPEQPGLEETLAGPLVALKKSATGMVQNRSLESEAVRLLEEHLDQVQRAAESRWEDAGLDAFAELERLVKDAKRALNTPPDNTWLGNVDRLLSRHLEEYENRLEQHWVPQKDTPDIASAARRIKDLPDGFHRDLEQEWEDKPAAERDVGDLARIVSDLQLGDTALSETREHLDRLRIYRFSAPNERSRIRASLKRLQRLASEVTKTSGLKGTELAKLLRESRGEPTSDPTGPETYLGALEAALQDQLMQRIREDYCSDFRNEVLSRYRDTLSGMSEGFTGGSEELQRLKSLLGSGGSLDALNSTYQYLPGGLTLPPTSLSSAITNADVWEWERFLSQLRGFLWGEDLESSSLPAMEVRIQPVLEDREATAWDTDADFRVWYHSLTRESFDLLAELEFTQGGQPVERLVVWRFDDKADGLFLRWTEVSDNKVDPADLIIKRDGLLAPMEMAWKWGQPIDASGSETREPSSKWRVKPSGFDRRAPMTFTFERPLPRLPKPLAD